MDIVQYIDNERTQEEEASLGPAPAQYDYRSAAREAVARYASQDHASAQQREAAVAQLARELLRSLLGNLGSRAFLEDVVGDSGEVVGLAFDIADQFYAMAEARRQALGRAPR